MTTRKPKNILVAPLDWGLGHTTRCIPIIRYLLSLGHGVIVAGNEWQRAFISATFNNIGAIALDGYNVTYSRWNKWAQAGVLAQLPRLHKTIMTEHDWLRHAAKDLQLDGIISDNRYGMFHNELPSVIMTHQLHVLSGMGNIIDRGVQKVHYKYLDRFNSSWIVDVPDAPGLGGILSHTRYPPQNPRYVGLLSQFEGINEAVDQDGSLLILLSGPEPQRSDLSRILWQQVQGYHGKVVFVEGSNTVLAPAHMPAHITYHNWLAGEKLTPLLLAADRVICRSGYSTIMDLIALGKKAILLPTPGQTEQEYLARHLLETGIFYSAKQENFDLNKAMGEADMHPYKSLGFNNPYMSYRPVLEDWIQTL